MDRVPITISGFAALEAELEGVAHDLLAWRLGAGANAAG